ARGQPAFRYDDTMRYADQLDVGEHRAGAQAAVVERGLDAGGIEFAVQRLGGLGHGRVVLRIDDADHRAPGRHRLGPDDAGFVVVLLDRGGDDARDADAVAAHRRVHGLAAFVQHGAAHRLGIAAPEREHVADLDAAGDPQRALAVGRGIALDHVADVGDVVRLGQVAAPVHAGEVVAGLVGADHEIGHRRHAA